VRIHKTAEGYTMQLSARDTYDWAHRSGAAWPCSTLSDHRVMVCVDSNGLCDFTLDGRTDGDVDGNELDACVSDHLPKDLRHLWPVWETVRA
jgi:hypothetical protein